MSGTSSRRKGAAYETEVVRYLRGTGVIHAQRALPGGHLAGGDITGMPGQVIECKNQQRLELGPWLDQMLTEMGEVNADRGVLVVKRRGWPDVPDHYAVTTVEQYVDLLAEAGYVEHVD